MNIKKWEPTKLREGTKTPKICRDMFISESRRRLVFCKVKNGRICTKVEISKDDASKLISQHKLVKSGSIFFSCYTYRDFDSTKLVNFLLK